MIIYDYFKNPYVDIITYLLLFPIILHFLKIKGVNIMVMLLIGLSFLVYFLKIYNYIFVILVNIIILFLIYIKGDFFD